MGMKVCSSSQPSSCCWLIISLAAWAVLAFTGIFWRPLHPSSAATCLLAMSVGCFVNAFKNRAHHRFITGPLFLIAAILLLSADPNHIKPNLIWMGVLAGAGTTFLLDWRNAHIIRTNEAAAEKLQRAFEGKQAIYIEKGALLVKVCKIRAGRSRQCVFVDLEQIPATGFPTGIYQELTVPHTWTSGAGFLTNFSDQTWHRGYGGWSLYFASRIVEGVLNLAVQFPDKLDAFQRYDEILRYLNEHKAHVPTKRLFPEECGGFIPRRL